MLLAREADTAAYSGRLGEARDFSRRAVASAERAAEKEKAASYEVDAALREALFGNAAAGRQRAAAALGLSIGRDVRYGAALALAMAGDAARAQALAEDLAKRFPEDTLCSSTTYQPSTLSLRSAATMLRRPSRLSRPPLLTSWETRPRPSPS